MSKCDHNWINITVRDAKRGKSYLCSECGKQKFIPVKLRKISDDEPLYFIVDGKTGVRTAIFKEVKHGCHYSSSNQDRAREEEVQ